MSKNIFLAKFFSVILVSSFMLIPALAKEGAVPKGVPQLDHVFVIMMENLGFNQIIGNPNAPFLNQYAKSANLGTQYFAIEHPSLPNYLDIIGGSNFNVKNDNEPDWHNAHCNSAQLSTMVCPIEGESRNFTGKMIGDQLVDSGRSWKSYQQNLPPFGADRVNFSDGFYTNMTKFEQIQPAMNPPFSLSDLAMLYAVKHNPFVYFRSVQEGKNPRNSLSNVVGFEGARGLFADLQSGAVPSLSFIAPNQCNDMHGLGNAGALCTMMVLGRGTQTGLNPALINRGDFTVESIVKAIHESPVWQKGHNVIVVVWDEDDYSLSTDSNRVVIIVDSNYGAQGLQSAKSYSHFSLLKTIEAGFALPCLNHACDEKTEVMSDLFSVKSDRAN